MKNDHEPTPEMEKKLNGCTSAEDVRNLMNAEDIELSPGDLETVSGGDVVYYKNGYKCVLHGYNVITLNGKKYFIDSEGIKSTYVCEHYDYNTTIIHPDGTCEVFYRDDPLKCYY